MLQHSYDKKILGKCPPRKTAPSPNSNANPKTNSEPDWGQFSSGQFSGHQ